MKKSTFTTKQIVFALRHAADRGMASAENERLAKQAGVKRVASRTSASRRRRGRPRSVYAGSVRPTDSGPGSKGGSTR